MKNPLSPRGLLAAILLLVPAAAAAEYGSGLAKGNELLSEIQLLHASLSRISQLLQSAEIPADDEIMSKAAKLVRRVRSLAYAAEGGQILNTRERRVAERQDASTQVGNEDRERRQLERAQRIARRDEREAKLNQLRDKRGMLRGGIGSGEAVALTQQREDLGRVLGRSSEEVAILEEYDEVARNLFDATITFPECKEMLLDNCLNLISAELLELELSAEFIIHEKRNQYQEGYHKVVIVTDLTADRVLGKLNDGKVDYPFLWDDAVLGYQHMLGVDGKWDCLTKTPEECCTTIQTSAPHPDTKGNLISCHIFVPYGGVGHPKRDDRVLINLSPDGRVHEPPVIH